MTNKNKKLLNYFLPVNNVRRKGFTVSPSEELIFTLFLFIFFSIYSVLLLLWLLSDKRTTEKSTKWNDGFALIELCIRCYRYIYYYFSISCFCSIFQTYSHVFGLFHLSVSRVLSIRLFHIWIRLNIKSCAWCVVLLLFVASETRRLNE